MNLKRKIYSKLIEWKNRSNGKTALLIEGARRIGKSTIVEKFGKENYDSFILIDFAKATNKVKNLFYEYLNDLDRLFQNLSLEYNVRLYKRKSLIIFDEIQKFPKARESIKYLVEDGRYDYIETGSLISIKENVEDIIIPSEEEKIRMFPLDFEEFCIASGDELLVDYIRDCYKNLKPLDEKYHRKASILIREYMLVGGMPQSVVAYLENNRDFYEADKAKRLILELYKDDIKKASNKYKYKVSALFENIPGYLSKHEKRITIKDITNDSNGTFKESLFWLDDSMICNVCYKCDDPNVGFALSKNDAFVKCYMCDTGLLVSLAFSENEISDMQLYKSIMNGKLSLNEGMIHENLISQIISSYGKKLYFYNHYAEEKHRNDIEIDFLLSNNSTINLKVIPIEVKSSKNYTIISHSKFKERFGKRISRAYVVHPKNLQVIDDCIYLPTYMFFAIFE